MVLSNGSQGGPGVSRNEVLVYSSDEIKRELDVTRNTHGRKYSASALLR